MDFNLKNKNVLLFAPAFFDYYLWIKKYIEKNGACTYLALENFSSKNIFYKYVYSKKTDYKYKYANRYYKKIIKRIDSNINYVLVIRGEAISPSIMELIKEKWPKAIFLMYQWDSVINNSNAIKIERYFDKVYTFDPIDAKENGWIYRPLFYIPELCNVKKQNEYKFSFIGTLYYKRACLYKKIKDFCWKKRLKSFLFLYVKKSEYLIHKYLLKDERYSILTKNEVNFKSLTQSQISDIYDSTDILVDYAAETQHGLTMRSIEAIGHKCRILTNNKTIIESGIDSRNLCIYDLKHFDIPDTFINGQYHETDKSVLEYYSLDGWINTIFGSINES